MTFGSDSYLGGCRCPNAAEHPGLHHSAAGQTCRSSFEAVSSLLHRLWCNELKVQEGRLFQPAHLGVLLFELSPPNIETSQYFQSKFQDPPRGWVNIWGGAFHVWPELSSSRKAQFFPVISPYVAFLTVFNRIFICFSLESPFCQRVPSAPTN